MAFTTRSLQADEVPPGTMSRAYVNNQEIAIYNVGGKFYATQNACTHMGGPLCEGSLSGDIVTCPWHGSQFNVTTGEVVQDPAEDPLTTYPVAVKDGVLVIGKP
jgi:3-phenylpropionate/trans-cinnamate dioxygenase ferredoxin subunit